MGMIDKEKLLRELPCISGYCIAYQCKHHKNSETLTVSECIGKVTKNFPEEPEIDFDALKKEFDSHCIKMEVKCSKCKYSIDIKETGNCFVDFLKSKNLTAPNPFEVPLKRTWTLKKEYADFVAENGVVSMKDTSMLSESNHRAKYYDLHEEPDYSKITKGSIVEFSDGRLRRVAKVVCDTLFYCDSKDSFEYSILTRYIKRIVELAKE